jgi:hypothetical protein
MQIRLLFDRFGREFLEILPKGGSRPKADGVDVKLPNPAIQQRFS